MNTKKGLMIVLFVMFNCYYISASLGISPAKLQVDFEPDAEFFVNFQIFGAESTQELYVYADGDLAEYVSFDKTNIIGQEAFTAYIKLPNEAKKPGLNKLYIRVAENKSSSNGFGTKLVIGALIIIKVPYPGQYAEIKSFQVNNKNENEPVSFSLVVENLGSENIYAGADINVYSDEKIIDSFSFSQKAITTKTIVGFEKIKEEGYSSGVYNATATFDYGKKLEISREFMIGQLFVDIVNWSENFIPGKMNKFNIDIESKWNNNINNIYAEVNVTKEGESVDFFKTPSVNLPQWGKATLTGFLNAETLETGKYESKIILYYEGKTTEKTVKINIGKPGLDWAVIGIVSIIAASVIILLLIIIIIIMLRKKKK